MDSCEAKNRAKAPRPVPEITLKIEIVYNNTSKNRLESLAPPFCFAIQDLEA
jgi:hypothetical protein